ncbi:MAG: hypothetical protein MRZ79_21650 [Bacteroidia bacterium]|nr:hypothetical protein [Bacteroidia bacterium]
MADRTHLDKVLIARISNKEKAYQNAFAIAEELDFEVVSFNPGGRNPRRVLSEMP